MPRHGETRARMVVGASTVFREHGIAGAALTDIADLSNAPRGSIYHHFPEGKAQLAAEATELAGRYIRHKIEQALALAPMEAVTALIDFFRDELPSSDFALGCPVAAGALEFGEAPAARKRAGEAFTHWESAVADGIARFGLPAPEAEELATVMVSAIEGALILARSQRSLRPFDRLESFLHRYLQSVLAAE